jgi:hypothetical protein
MKTKFINLALFISLLTFLSCSEETSISNQEQKKETNATLFFNLNGENLTTTQNKSGDKIHFCFDLVYPISMSVSDYSRIIIEDESQLYDLIQNQSLQCVSNAIDYPIRATNIVTSESNLGDVPIAYEGGNNNNNGDGIGSNIVTSESNLGDVPRALDINSQEELLRLFQNCK